MHLDQQQEDGKEPEDVERLPSQPVLGGDGAYSATSMQANRELAAAADPVDAVQAWRLSPSIDERVEAPPAAVSSSQVGSKPESSSLGIREVLLLTGPGRTRKEWETDTHPLPGTPTCSQAAEPTSSAESRARSGWWAARSSGGYRSSGSQVRRSQHHRLVSQRP